MAKRKQSKAHKGQGLRQFVGIPYTMLRSAAWRSLSGPAVKVWVELHSRYWGGNNGDLSLSLDEGKRLLNLGKTTIMRALAELEDKGFIKQISRGQWYGRKASTYAVTDQRLNGENPTRDWQNWLPQKQSLGPDAERGPPLTVPSQDREMRDGSVSGPVEAENG